MSSTTRSEPRRPDSSRSLLVQDGEIGVVLKGGKFRPVTNFALEVVFSVRSPPDSPPLCGFVYAIKTSDGCSREVFVSNDDAQTVRSFVKAARKVHPALQYTKTSDTLWSQYIFKLCQEYRQLSTFTTKTLVVSVGKQPATDVWVLGESLQLDAWGSQIPAEDHLFYWYSDYIPGPDSRLFALPVHQPLGIHGLEGVVSAARNCLESNFIPCFLVIAGSVLTLHYETVMSMVDCCPIVLAYSKESGTGKTTALKMALSLYGIYTCLGGKSTLASITNRAAVATIPIGLDDVRSDIVMEDIAVQFYNSSSHATMSSGIKKPRSSVIVTANKSFCATESRSVRTFNRAICAAMGDKYHAYKMLLVGETESGKTSLFDLLCNCKARGLNKASVQSCQCTGDIKMCNIEVNMCELNVGVINTPEFGGPCWREKDREHTESINGVLKMGDHINCVCLVINGRQSCMAVTFKYALTEITSILPKEVLKNIIVVFTNTADLLSLTFDTTSLQEYLGREIEPASIFCIDCKSSQDETAEVLTELWTHIKSFQLVHTSHFTVLYQKRQKIEKTILDLLKTYDDLKRLEKELKNAEEEIDSALRQKHLCANFQSTLKLVRWITVRTSDHNTLCCYRGCYSNCHEHCSLPKSFDKEDFKSCGGVGGTYCSKCGHHYTLHYHGDMRWEIQQTEQLHIDEKMKMKFEEAKSMEERAKSVKQQLEQEKAELKLGSLFESLLQTKKEFQELSLNRRYTKIVENHLTMIKQSGTAGKATREEIEKKLKVVRADNFSDLTLALGLTPL